VVLKRESLNEGRSFRGTTDIRMKDLQALVDEMREKGIKAGRLAPEGGVLDCGGWPFDPNIWKGFGPQSGAALAKASTDSSRDVYTQHVPQGGTVTKKNYGGRVGYTPGPTRPHANDSLGSTMDRYDVVMVADVGQRVTKTGKTVQTGSLQRLVYSPAIGTGEERRARLEALLAGQTPPPIGRRPQPEVPVPDRDTTGPAAQPVRRQGQNVRPSKDESFLYEMFLEEAVEQPLTPEQVEGMAPGAVEELRQELESPNEWNHRRGAFARVTFVKVPKGKGVGLRARAPFAAKIPVPDSDDFEVWNYYPDLHMWRLAPAKGPLPAFKRDAISMADAEKDFPNAMPYFDHQVLGVVGHDAKANFYRSGGYPDGTINVKVQQKGGKTSTWSWSEKDQEWQSASPRRDLSKDTAETLLRDYAGKWVTGSDLKRIAKELGGGDMGSSILKFVGRLIAAGVFSDWEIPEQTSLGRLHGRPVTNWGPGGSIRTRFKVCRPGEEPRTTYG
jgi:hypothetical protein